MTSTTAPVSVSATPCRAMDLARGPGFVVARGGRAVPTLVVMAGRAIAQRGPGQVWQMRLLPGVARGLGQRRIRGVVQPGVPLGRNFGGLGLPLVDHPTPGAQGLRADPLILIIHVARRIRANATTIQAGEKPGTESHGPTYTHKRRVWSIGGSRFTGSGIYPQDFGP